MTSYTWSISRLDCYAQSEGKTDVVFVAWWTLLGTNGFYEGSVSGTQGLNYNGQSPFTPYENLTEQQVIDWVKDAMGADLISKYEYDIESQIASESKPVVVTPPLPWSA
jgi:hypothetical protein